MGFDVNKKVVTGETRPSHEEAIASAVCQLFKIPDGPSRICSDCFFQWMKDGEMKLSDQKVFVFAYMDGYEHAVNDMVSGRVTLKMLKIDKHGEENNGNT